MSVKPIIAPAPPCRPMNLASTISISLTGAVSSSSSVPLRRSSANWRMVIKRHEQDQLHGRLKEDVHQRRLLADEERHREGVAAQHEEHRDHGVGDRRTEQRAQLLASRVRNASRGARSREAQKQLLQAGAGIGNFSTAMPACTSARTAAAAPPSTGQRQGRAGFPGHADAGRLPARASSARSHADAGSRPPRPAMDGQQPPSSRMAHGGDARSRPGCARSPARRSAAQGCRSSPRNSMIWRGSRPLVGSSSTSSWARAERPGRSRPAAGSRATGADDDAAHAAEG